MINRRHERAAVRVALLILLLKAFSAVAQPIQTPRVEDREQIRALAVNYYQIGWAEFGRGNISSAIQNYLESKRLFERAQARRDLIYVLADLGTLYIYNSNYKEALACSEQSLALAEQLKGSTESPGAWPDDYGVGTALSNLGNISRREGEYEKAIAYFEKSIAAYWRIDGGTGKFSVEILDDLADIGRTYSGAGDYLRALSFLDQAMSLARTSHPDRVASISNSLGILYLNQRDYSKAIDFFKRGLQLAVGVRDRFRQADMLLNLGVAFQFKRDYVSALEAFGKALEIAKQINYSELLIPAQEGIGCVYKDQGRHKEALASFDQGLLLARQSRDKTRIAELLWRKSEVQLAGGNVTAAIQDASQAVDLAEQLRLGNVPYLALTTLGRAYRATKQDQLAKDTFARAIRGIEEMRGRVAGLEPQSEMFFEDKVGPYHEMIDLLMKSGQEQSYGEALILAERAKARVLFDVLSRGRVDLAGAMTFSEKQEDERLNREIATLNVRIAEEGNRKPSDGILVTSLNEELRQVRLKYETFQNSLYAAHSNPSTQNSRTRPLTIDRLASLVSERTALLEYVMSGKTTYLFCLTKKMPSSTLELKVYPLAIDEKELAKQALEFREMVATRDPTFADVARNLYAALIKPAEAQLSGKESLCIVPDGVLWDVPFQALQTNEGNYLLQSYAIYYAPSLSILAEAAHEKKESTIPTSVLAFGNPRFGAEAAANIKATYRGESLAPLPDSEAEVKALRDIWGANHTQVYVNASAGKRVFKAEATKFSVIHLATHGILDNSNPLYSRLVLARQDNDPSDDGLLEAREIMQLNLRADLVVLSACQTARGRIGAGEGVVGISWAFLVAGVPTTVVSQWNVDSAATARLMVSFHRHLKERKGLKTAEALRQAALELLNEKAHQHPFYWASFVLVGQAR